VFLTTARSPVLSAAITFDVMLLLARLGPGERVSDRTMLLTGSCMNYATTVVEERVMRDYSRRRRRLAVQGAVDLDLPFPKQRQ